jgi:hypothetical protein
VERLSPTKSPKHNSNEKFDPNSSFELKVTDAEKKTVTVSLRSNRKIEPDANYRSKSKASLMFKHDTTSIGNGSLGADS